MANHKSAKKRTRQAIVRTASNRTKTSKTRNITKKLRDAISANDKETATSLLKTAQGLLSKLAKTGVIKKNNASRKTSRLAAQIAKL